MFQDGGGGQDGVECSVPSFMEELQRYECLYNKFSKDYKAKQVRDNCWKALGERFKLTAEEAERKYKSIRSSYGRWLRKAKQVPSGSGRDAVPVPGGFANLGWLEKHISHRQRSSNFNGVESEMDESMSPEVENQNLQDEEDDEESDLGEDHVDVVKIIENGENLAKKAAKKTK